MYKVFTSLWSKPALPTSALNKTRLSSTTSSDSLSIDEDSWVFVNDTAMVSKVTPPILPSDNNMSNSIMATSWIASPPFVRTDHSPSMNNRSTSPTTHHFNPIENLLIEHASMSVYEQIASRTRTKRHRKAFNEQKLDEQVEEIKDGDQDDEDDDEDRSSVVLQCTSQHPNSSSIHHRNLNASLSHSTNSSLSALESSTSSLAAHQRHLHRIHQRRRRSTRTASKLLLSSNADESKLPSNKIIDRQRFNYARAPKIVLHQPGRSNH